MSASLHVPWCCATQTSDIGLRNPEDELYHLGFNLRMSHRHEQQSKFYALGSYVLVSTCNVCESVLL
jgi:hypothetical protein